MNTTTLFVNAGEAHAHLADVAARVFQSLGISEWEERQSANYPPNDHYFAGYAQNACIQVHDCDSDLKPDYPFHISVENPTWRIGRGIIDTDPPKVAKLLVDGGFTVFIPHGAWYLAGWDGDGEVYAD